MVREALVLMWHFRPSCASTLTILCTPCRIRADDGLANLPLVMEVSRSIYLTIVEQSRSSYSLNRLCSSELSSVILASSSCSIEPSPKGQHRAH